MHVHQSACSARCRRRSDHPCVCGSRPTSAQRKRASGAMACHRALSPPSALGCVGHPLQGRSHEASPAPVPPGVLSRARLRRASPAVAASQRSSERQGGRSALLSSCAAARRAYGRRGCWRRCRTPPPPNAARYRRRDAVKSARWLGGALAATGCASAPPKASFDDVSALVAERGGARIHWDQGTPADEQVRARVHDLVTGTLTPDRAVEVALLRNQGLVATYEELGIAQADLVQAGLLRNPSFGARVRFPTSGPGTFIDTEFSIAQDFLDLFTLPLRKRVATAQLNAAKARVGSAVLELTAQVRQAVVSLQAAQATVEVRKLVLEAQSAAAELRARQRAVGNVGDLDVFQEQAFFEQSKLDLARVEQQAVEQREQVNRLLGLWGPDSATWKVESRLPDVPERDPSLEHVESLAIGRRLDLLAVRAEAQALEQAASLGGLTRALPALQAGVSTGRDAEGTRVTGPELSVELPIFDQGQARAARLLAQSGQALARQAALAVNVRAEVRALRNRLITTHRSAEHYRTVLLPLREKSVKESQLRYNAMLLGVFQLLQARREQIEVYRDYLDTVRDYWITRAELERATGGSLDAQAPKEKNL